tara:strand:- start:1461 stop:1628 length:168 start_codon:yes stop_codon:yes gene_type:complete
MKAINEYVVEDNELDIKVRRVYQRLVDLEADSHPPIFSSKERDSILKRLSKLEKR